jgi:predicted GNAT family N-acyltransferase
VIRLMKKNIGEVFMSIEITSFSESEKDIRSVRDKVFGQEQGVPRELDWDGEDSCCTHVLARDDSGIPIGTGRMRPDGKIGRLAVLLDQRGHGIGGALLKLLVFKAYEYKFKSVYLYAQTHAVSFYEKYGFCKEGTEFIEAGIPHIKMVRFL